MTVRPAQVGQGIWFRRLDVTDSDPMVPARWDAVEQVPLCTRVVNADGVSVSTIEHLMAALAGCGIHNALVEIDGPEVPILDGSAAEFVRAFLARGVVELPEPLHVLRVTETVEVSRGDAWARLEPSDRLEIAFAIDFPDDAIGRQEAHLDLSNGAFIRELSDCRTFCRFGDVERMRAEGLVRGGSLSNAVVVDGARILTPGGLRRRDEAVRHKMLDAFGDLALAGAPILGRYVGHRAGHALTNALLRELFATPDAYVIATSTPETRRILPGAGVSADDLAAVA